MATFYNKHTISSERVFLQMQNIGLFRNDWWNESKVIVDDTFVLSALWDRTRNVLDFKEKAL